MAAALEPTWDLVNLEDESAVFTRPAPFDGEAPAPQSKHCLKVEVATSKAALLYEADPVTFMAHWTRLAPTRLW